MLRREGTDKVTYEVDVDSDGAALADGTILIDEAEFNERKWMCRDVDVKLARGAEGAAAENSTKWF